MLNKLKTSLAVALLIGGAGIALAEEAHHNGSSEKDAMAPMASPKTTPGMKDGENGMMSSAGHHEMMQKMKSMMMTMHGNAPNTSGSTTMHQMDKDMMQMMDGSMNRMSADENGDGQVSRTEIMDRMKSLHMMADTDENGMISLGEFEMLHGMLMKERMVDRFQHLDADGDGEITQQEMMAPGARMRSEEPSMGGSHSNQSQTGN